MKVYKCHVFVWLRIQLCVHKRKLDCCVGTILLWPYMAKWIPDKRLFTSLIYRTKLLKLASETTIVHVTQVLCARVRRIQIEPQTLERYSCLTLVVSVTVCGDVFQFCFSFFFDPCLISYKLQFFKLGYFKNADVSILPSQFFLLTSKTALGNSYTFINLAQFSFYSVASKDIWQTAKIELAKNLQNKKFPGIQVLLNGHTFSQTGTFQTHYMTWTKMSYKRWFLSFPSVLICQLFTLKYKYSMCSCAVLCCIEYLYSFRQL